MGKYCLLLADAKVEEKTKEAKGNVVTLSF